MQLPPAMDIEIGSFISIDVQNNIYFAGIHYDNAKFDHITMNTDATLGTLKIGTIFISKLNTQGKVQWVKNAESKKIIRSNYRLGV